MAHMGRIPHKRVLFQVKLQVYESRVGISPVEAIDMVGNMSFWSVKRTKRYFFMAVKKSIKSSGFVIYYPLKDCIYYSCSYENPKFKPRYVKRVPEAGHFSIEGYTKRGAFL